ncbi:MAG: diol dehydratase small subunit [Alphaproteobacteria bacterium]
MTRAFDPSDYPIGEKRLDLVATPTGRPVSDLTAPAFAEGRVGRADIGITAEGLRRQAEVARAAGRARLADNFERGAELVAVPDDVLIATYELLRPGRARDRAELEAAAAELRRAYGAERIAWLIEDAAEVYERRGLFRRRF